MRSMLAGEKKFFSFRISPFFASAGSFLDSTAIARDAPGSESGKKGQDGHRCCGSTLMDVINRFAAEFGRKEEELLSICLPVVAQHRTGRGVAKFYGAKPSTV